MAEKKTTKAAATKKVTAEKATAKVPAKKAPAKKTVKESVLYINAENAGFRAGDVYQVLAAAAGKALTVAEIAKAAKVTEPETILGLGWLLKEGKVASTEDNKVVLA